MNNEAPVSEALQKEEQIRFYDQRYSDIDRALIRLEEPNLSYDKRLMDEILSEVQRSPGSTILEICAGQGIDGILLSDNIGVMVCTDISREALKVAGELAVVYKKKNIEFIQCDAEFLPFKSDTFDLVFGKDALHHVTHPVGVIKEMRRCAKNSSKVVAIEANPLNPQMAFIGLIYYHVDKGVFQNTEENLRKYFATSDLQDITIKHLEFFPRHVLFYVSSPFPRIIRKYPSLLELLRTMNIFGRKCEKVRYIQKFSNFLFIRGIKTGKKEGEDIH